MQEIRMIPKKQHLCIKGGSIGKSDFMNKIQIALMQSLGLNQDTPLDIIEDKVSEYLEKNGFDENYNITDEGKICESILDCINDVEEE